jgi:iron complex outermembrane recepter protein
MTVERRHLATFGSHAAAVLAGFFGFMTGGAAYADGPTEQAAAPAEEVTELETIVVTARKRDESLAVVPESITAFTAANLEDYNIQSFNDYASKAPNLSFSYSGGPTGISEARTVAIRGITGQNLSGTAGATGFYIDDTPLPGSVDPRVLDIDNIEVLKGPQGTLYGESSLGGNVRLITKKPSLTENSLSISAEAGLTSGASDPDGGAGIIGNIVLVPDKLAIHIVGFGSYDAGYLTRTFPTDPASPGVTDPTLTVPRTSVGNQGEIRSYGGSISALWQITENFDARLRLMQQDQYDNGFPATFAPLPDFTPVYTLNRAFDVQPWASDVWTLPSLDLEYRGSGWDIVSSTGYFYRHAVDVEDSTYGTQQVLTNYYLVTGLPNQAYLWDGDHIQKQLSSELRFSFDPIHNVSGTVGAFFSNASTDFSIPPTFANGLAAATAGQVTNPSGFPPYGPSSVVNVGVSPDLIWTQNGPGTERDFSLFGEFYWKLVDQWTVTLGARQYWLQQDTNYTANGYMDDGFFASPPENNSETGFDPKLGVAFQADDNTMVYGSASKGFRAGGAQPYFSFCADPNINPEAITHLKSDTLWTYELGTKIQVPHPGLLVTAAVFDIDWNNIQQEVALPCGAYFVINGNKATIKGAEVEVDGHLTRSLQIRVGAGYEKTDITNPGALIDVDIEPGSRILTTPALTATAGGVYTVALSGERSAFMSADYSYTGNSVQLLAGGYGAEQTRPGYSLVNARVGLDWGKSELALNVKNLTNAKPNLGDIGYVGYAQYANYAAGTVIPQVGTLPPLTFMVQYKHTF